MVSSSGSIFGDACPVTVSPAQLHSLDSSSVSVLDASWHMPGSSRDPRTDWLGIRIPGSRFLDLDQVASPHELGLKHMMPTPETFAEACESLGIAPDSHVIIYDSHGIFSSPRALFMFRAFGHHRSSVLDGGLPAWMAHGCRTERGEPDPAERSTYPVPELDQSVIKSYEQMTTNARFDPAFEPLADIVLDARSRERFLGIAPEPREGLSSGHIPHAFSLPFGAFLDSNLMPRPVPYTAVPADIHRSLAVPAESERPSDSTLGYPTISEKPAPTKVFSYRLPDTYATLKSSTRLRAALVDAVGPRRAVEVLEGRRGVVASCGSGMTAGVLWLGLQAMGAEGKAAIYDESWTGYAMRPESEIEKEE